jgi:hypothetical protein
MSNVSYFGNVRLLDPAANVSVQKVLVGKRPVTYFASDANNIIAHAFQIGDDIFTVYIIVIASSSFPQMSHNIILVRRRVFA